MSSAETLSASQAEREEMAKRFGSRRWELGSGHGNPTEKVKNWMVLVEGDYPGPLWGTPRYVYLTTRMAKELLASDMFTPGQYQNFWPKTFVARGGSVYFRKDRKHRLSAIGEGAQVPEWHHDQIRMVDRPSVLEWRGLDVRPKEDIEQPADSIEPIKPNPAQSRKRKRDSEEADIQPSSIRVPLVDTDWSWLDPKHVRNCQPRWSLWNGSSDQLVESLGSKDRSKPLLVCWSGSGLADSVGASPTAGEAVLFLREHDLVLVFAATSDPLRARLTHMVTHSLTIAGKQNATPIIIVCDGLLERATDVDKALFRLVLSKSFFNGGKSECYICAGEMKLPNLNSWFSQK